MIEDGDGLIYCSIATLLKQRSQAKLLQRGSKNVHARQTGQHLSVHKGRGMAFAESRLYQPGDDVRMLDWRVTARTGKVHTKIFEEERERPVLLWVDLRPTMFFATRGCYKSVLAAKMASMIMWKSWLDGDRVGGVVIDAQGNPSIFKPTRSLAGMSRFFQTLSTATQASPDSISKDRSFPLLADVLKPLQHIVGVGTQIIMLSDFRGLDKAAEHQLLTIKHQSSLNLIHIADPFEQELSAIGHLRMSFGSRFFNMNLKDKNITDSYHNLVKERENRLIQLSRQLKASLLSLSTADKWTVQLVKVSRGLG